MSKLTNSSNMSSVGKSRTIGTDQWRAPEYWHITPEYVEARSNFPFAGDIYAFAIVLGEIATKTIPWKDFGSSDMKEAVCQGLRPYSEKTIKEPLFSVMVQAWASKPQDRLIMKKMVLLLESHFKPTSPVEIRSIVVKDIKIDSKNDSPQTPTRHIDSESATIQNQAIKKEKDRKVDANAISNNPQKIEPIQPQDFKNDFLSLNTPNFQIMLMIFKKALVSVNIDLLKPSLMKLLQTVSIATIDAFISNLKEIDLSLLRISAGDTLFTAICKYFGIGHEIDDSKTFLMFKSCKDPIAQVFLGYMHECGNGTEEEPSAFNCYSLASKSNISMAYYYLASCYENGTGCTKNEGQAIHFYELSYFKGFHEAWVGLGGIYYQRNDYKKAIECFTRAIEYEMPMGYHNMGVMYLHGYGCERNYSLALESFQKAIESNIPESHNYIASMYEEGYGVNKNVDLALQYYKNAVKYGKLDSTAKVVELTNLIETLMDVPSVGEADIIKLVGPAIKLPLELKLESSVNEPEKFKQYFLQIISEFADMETINRFLSTCYKKYQTNGPEFVQIYIKLKSDRLMHGIMFFFGIGCEQSYEKAMNILKALTVPVAVYLTAIMCYDGKPEPADKATSIQLLFTIKKEGYAATMLGIYLKNEKDKLECFKIGAKQNHAFAIYYLGFMQEKESEIEKAIEFYSRSGALGCGLAYCQMAAIYFQGKEVVQNYETAFLYALKAANLRCAKGFHSLAIFHRNGFGCEKHVLKAMKLYQIAVYLGDIDSLIDLSDLYKDCGQFSLAKDSLHRLGVIYKKGLGVTPDLKKAEKYLIEAAELQEK
eukprot:NODE_151_length_15465_cov_0.405376.p2 type:complete len:822 gc:universal NODE_151_length_15465_cov_0.405376:13761-11296(-)